MAVPGEPGVEMVTGLVTDVVTELVEEVVAAELLVTPPWPGPPVPPGAGAGAPGDWPREPGPSAVWLPDVTAKTTPDVAAATRTTSAMVGKMRPTRAIRGTQNQLRCPTAWRSAATWPAGGGPAGVAWTSASRAADSR